jgi:Protein of unknown function (DUF4238)
MSEPKQHHYIPETYLENFCGEDGVLWLHDKWEGKSFPSRPTKVLKEHFYYAQPDHERKVWNHNIEKFFSEKIERDWPSTVRLIHEGANAVKNLRHFYMFLYAMRVRVPNCRKSVEYALQQQVKVVSGLIKDKKFLDDEKRGIAQINKVLNSNFRNMEELYGAGVINITIDPHRSLLAMVDLAKGFSLVVSTIQLHFVKNCTAADFNCSDNPIVYFPAGQQPHRCEPYQFRPKRPFEFIFPITVGAFADRFVVSSRELDAHELPPMNSCPRLNAYKNPQQHGTFMYLQYEMGEPLRGASAPSSPPGLTRWSMLSSGRRVG